MIFLIVMLVCGVYWAYDFFALRPKRKAQQEKEPTLTSYARGVFLILLIIQLIQRFNLNIVTLLVLLTVGSGAIYLVDKYLTGRQRSGKDPLLVDYAKSLFPVFLVVLLLRAFIVQPYEVPTGSLEPTVMPGDFLAVGQFSYGLKLPILNTTLLKTGEPKIGDIVVFRYPVDESVDYVKRVIGVPGTHVVYKNKVLYINGQKMTQTYVGPGVDVEPYGNIPVNVYEENLMGIKHLINLRPQGGQTTDFDITVPQGYYFMMGDNRDDSADSRVWGFVPEKNLIGQAWIVLFSWSGGPHFDRVGTRL